MRVAISQKHLSLNKRLAKGINRLARGFNNQSYSKIENIDSILLKRDISVEEKKGILIEKLHGLIVKAFSINKRKFSKKAFDSLKKRLAGIRKVIIKLRSINYYLETMFLEDLRLLKIKITAKSAGLRQQKSLARDELEALEYTAYKLIEEVVMLDKKLLREYAHKQKKAAAKEKIGIKDLGSILGKESELLEHLEAKLPPPRQATIALMKEPLFTHWVARIFALVSYLEHLCCKEAKIFAKLKKNKSARARISKKILHLARERSKLLKIMEEKAVSMNKFMLDNELKKELRNLTTTISL